MTSAPDGAGSTARRALRQRLLQQREAFVASPAAEAAGASLARHLTEVLKALEPALLGMYWPHRSEFNAASLLTADASWAELPVCLPFAQRSPVQMHYRAWNREAPTASDECGMPTSDGQKVVPDVVLVPCVGYTASGHRLGYGGGYFDRWLAAHAGTTAIGIAWSWSQIGTAEGFVAEPHDQPLSIVVTESGAL